MTAFNKHDEQFMLEALKLARKGIGLVEPNPPVGCVIVKNGKVIGKGFHRKFGHAHAEVNAIANCRRRGHDPKGSTMYVTLAPCAHFGKTPPCSEVIRKAKIARVVIAATDPAKYRPKTGLSQLRSAGIKVDIGLCGPEARKLIAPFTTLVRHNRPWVILKWAQTLDGKLAYVAGHNEKWISGEASRADVHRLRREVQAIAVSSATVAVDDPMLTPRPAHGKKPLRVIIDSRLVVPLKSRVLNSTASGPVMVMATRDAIADHAKKAETMRSMGVEIAAVPASAGHCSLRAVMAHLARRGIQRLLVEPGPGFAEAILAEDLADEIFIYVAPKILGSAGAADMGTVLSALPQSLDLRDVNVTRFDNDVRIRALVAHR